MKFTKFLAVLLCCVFLISLFAGCGSSSTDDESEEATEEIAETSEDAEETVTDDETEEAEEEETVDEEEESAITLPLVDEAVTLTVWAVAAPFYAGYLDDLGDIYVLSVLAERTNVYLDYTTISYQAETESFGVMISSGDYDDIITKFVDLYNNGADDGISEGIIIDLTDLIAEYCPNLQEIIDTDDDVREGITTIEGQIAEFPIMYNEPEPGPSNGLGIRQDWLDELGLDTPETYDELYNVLVQFKTYYDATMFIPQDGVNVENMLASGYGVNGNVADDGGIYVVDGVVKSALLEDGYVEFLTMMNDWYSEGLIDPDFMSYEDEFINSHIEVVTTGANGVASIDTDSFVTLKNSSTDSDFELSPLADVTMEEGETLHFGQETSTYGGGSWSISGDSEYAELICEYVNYLFSEEGIFLTNYGTEGYTFDYDDDGEPVYTEFITNNEDDIEMYMMFLTQLAHTGSPFPYIMIYDRTYYLLEDIQVEARYVWSSNTDYAYVFPDNATFTTEENDRVNELFPDIETLVSENVMKFIVGDRSLDEYDDFVDDLLTMGLEELVSLYQDAYDRYAA